MDTLGQYAIFAVIAVVIVAIGILSYKHEKERREGMRALAKTLGLHFYPEPDSTFAEARNHKWFQQGRARVARNRIEGTREIRGERFTVMMGDYRWTTGSGKSTQHHAAGYLLIRPTWPALPNLVIRTETFFDKVGDALGFDDIDFESAEFSRKFMVKSTDKRFAYAVVHARMMEFLLKGTAYPVDLNYGECLFLGLGMRPSLAEFGNALEWAEQFFTHWPDHLVNEIST